MPILKPKETLPEDFFEEEDNSIFLMKSNPKGSDNFIIGNLVPVEKKIGHIRAKLPVKKKEEKLIIKDSISNEEIENLKMDWKFIDKVGVELEGAWLDPRNDLHEDLSFGRDDFDLKYCSVGEYTSNPLSNSIDLFKCIRDNYPDYAKPIRNSCAFHIHFSLKNPALYAACMNEEFYLNFLEAIVSWGKKYPCKNEEFWSRVEGENRYCRREFKPDFQAAFAEKGRNRESRRTQLNYCYRHLGTIECRLFPVFDEAKTAIFATKALLFFVEDFLSKNQLKELEVTEKIPDIIEENQSKYETVNLEAKNKQNTLFKFNYFAHTESESNIREIRELSDFNY